MSAGRYKNETKETFARRANMSGTVAFVLAFIKDFIKAFHPELSLDIAFGCAAVIIMFIIFMVGSDRIDCIDIGDFGERQGFECITAAAAFLFCVENIFGALEMKLLFSAIAFAIVVMLCMNRMKCHI